MTNDVITKALKKASTRILSLSVESVARFFVSYSEKSKAIAEKAKITMAVLLTKYRDQADGVIVAYNGKNYRIDINTTGGASTYDKEALIALAYKHGATTVEVEACKKQTREGETIKYSACK